MSNKESGLGVLIPLRSQATTAAKQNPNIACEMKIKKFGFL